MVEKKDILKETFEFVESSLPSPDITVNIEKTIAKKEMANEIKKEYARGLSNRLKKLKNEPILAYYQPQTNVIVINKLQKDFDDIIKTIDHEYIHAVLHGLGMHEESSLLDKKHGHINLIEKGGV